MITRHAIPSSFSGGRRNRSAWIQHSREPGSISCLHHSQWDHNRKKSCTSTLYQWCYSSRYTKCPDYYVFVRNDDHSFTIIIGNNEDYIGVTQPLTFSPGSGSQQQCTDVVILDDDVIESDETFLVTLDTLDVSDREHVNFNPFATSTVTITNDDSKR